MKIKAKFAQEKLYFKDFQSSKQSCKNIFWTACQTAIKASQIFLSLSLLLYSFQQLYMTYEILPCWQFLEKNSAPSFPSMGL